MATCGDCQKFGKCYDYNKHLESLNEDHEICERYRERLAHTKRYVHNGVECFDVLEATLTPSEVIGFYKGCIIKYLFREHDKDGWKDLQKAEMYARRMNIFCATIGRPGDVPQDASTESAADTD